MTWRGAAGLVLVLAILVATIQWVDHRAQQPTPVGRTPLLGAAPSTVTALEIRTPDRTLRFERDGDSWHDTSDAHAKVANDVPGLLTALGMLAPLMVVTDTTTTLDEFGLGSDAVRLIAHSGGESVLDLHLGSRNPAWTAIYVRRDGSSEVLLVGSLLRYEIEKLTPLTLHSETRDPFGSRSAKEAP